ncbi:MAG TPA: anthranilate synthase component I [Nitrospirota bacterium]|nr:anthranilate synthase component I [Nitrospirota bacterium]
MFQPSLEEFKKKAKQGNLIPVYREILADMETPVSAFRKIDDGHHSFLLESVEGGEKWGRYSFLGSRPSVVVRSFDLKVEIIRKGDVEMHAFERDPLESIKKILSAYRPVPDPALPRFFGGAVGFMGYDVVRFFEDLPNRDKTGLDLPDIFFMITDTLVIFDNITHKIKVVSNAHVEGKSVTAAYKEATGKIDAIVAKLKRAKSYRTRAATDRKSRNKPPALVSNFTQPQYEKAVLKAKEYIKAGDIFQVVPSQRFHTTISVEPFEVYRALRLINPSPYMYFLRCGSATIVGASPEVMVRLEGDRIELRPIAGTRRRGATEDEDKALEKDLLADPKERAEHIMLVDLGRNDVGRVSEPGSVNVSELMVIERYSHVMHIVSNVRGTISAGNDSYDVIRACFPAGTVSGAPKIRAMEIIEELEPTRRGPYAGAVGYFGFSGNMDTCITIRTLVIKGGIAYIQAGGGIVADSNPAAEYQETVNKAKAMMRAVEMAEKGLE